MECTLNLFTNFCLALGLFMLILYFANYPLWGENARIIYLSRTFRLGTLTDTTCVARISVYSSIFCPFEGFLSYEEKQMLNYSPWRSKYLCLGNLAEKDFPSRHISKTKYWLLGRKNTNTVLTCDQASLSFYWRREGTPDTITWLFVCC